MINESFGNDETKVVNRESLSSRISRCNNIGTDQIEEYIVKFYEQPIKKMLLMKNGRFDKEFADFVFEYLKMADYDYDNCTMLKFMVEFERLLLSIQNSPEYGIKPEDCRYLPIYLFLRKLRDSIPQNSVAKRLFSIGYEDFEEYIRDRFLCLEPRKRKRERTTSKPQKVETLYDYLKSGIEMCTNYWVPGEEIDDYLLKIRTAHDLLYMNVYFPIVKTSFRLANNKKYEEG